VQVFNVFGELEYEHDHPGFSWRRASVTRAVGGQELGMSVLELPPGERTFPYHFHLANEEWLLVLAGEPTLREPAGERRLRAGDAVAFPVGPDGAHQLRNDTDQPVRLALVSTRLEPEVVEYPDSGKIAVSGAGADYVVARGPELGYWEGES
jgi:uncharacterized cupin superfamily protein